MRNQTPLSDSAFRQWQTDAAQGRTPAVRFIKRRFMRSRAQELEAFYIPAIGRVLQVVFTRYSETWWEPSFHIKPGDALAEYRETKNQPNTYYLDRVVYSHKRRAFQCQAIPAAAALWKAFERRGLSWRRLGFSEHEGEGLDLEASPQDIATLCLACESREFVFPYSRRGAGNSASKSQSTSHQK